MRKRRFASSESGREYFYPEIQRVAVQILTDVYGFLNQFASNQTTAFILCIKVRKDKALDVILRLPSSGIRF